MSLQRLPCWDGIIWPNSVGAFAEYLLFHALLMRYWNYKTAHAVHLHRRRRQEGRAGAFSSNIQVKYQRCRLSPERSRGQEPRDKSSLTPQVRVMALRVRWCPPMLNLISRQAAFSESTHSTADGAQTRARTVYYGCKCNYCIINSPADYLSRRAATISQSKGN